jgi:hypothetical protein
VFILGDQALERGPKSKEDIVKRRISDPITSEIAVNLHKRPRFIIYAH